MSVYGLLGQAEDRSCPQSLRYAICFRATGDWSSNRNLLSAVAAVFVGTFAVTLCATAGMLDDIRSRDKLICGVSEGLPDFSEKDGSDVWRGFDVDFCKAVAAALLGDTAKVEYVPLSATVRFDALTDRRIDLL